jgi:uncharacterized protein
MPRPIHFDIYADDPARAAKFYTDVFSWKFEKWDNPDMDYWMITTGPDGEPGINGGMTKRDDKADKGFAHAATLTMAVPDADEYTEKIKSHGGTLVSPKMAIPGFGWFVGLKDTEGNMIGIMQNDPGAK